MLRLLLFISLLGVSLNGSATTLSRDNPELKQFIGLKSLFLRIHSTTAGDKKGCTLPPRYHRSSATEQAKLTGEWQQFRTVASRVLGNGAIQNLGYPQFCAVFTKAARHHLKVKAGALEADRQVERMHILGYTLHEIASVLNGNISLRALRNVQAMRATGYTDNAINAYLQRHYRHNTAPRHRPVSLARTQRAQLDALVVRHARNHGVDPNLIRAVISNESSWHTRAVSRAGAIGLMQLMPATAEMLGVDPKRPDQNIEGGIRYLAGLLKLFKGDVDAALVAYNAGPSHARKWRSGKTVLYGETRTYLQRVKSSYTNRSF